MRSELSFAQDLKYEISSYGERFLVLKITGELANSISVTPQKEGRILRISALQGSFTTSENSLPKNIKSITQFKAAESTDLIVTLTETSSVNVVPNSSGTQIMIRFKNKPKSTQKVSNIPAKNSDKPLKILLPSPELLSGKTVVGGFLLKSAYTVDLIWSVITGQDLKEQRRDLETSSKPKAVDCSDLEKLVDELSAEVMALQKEIAQSNDKQQGKARNN
ncbi:MAG: hypothetical protein H6619_00610 [Deltaproteobacteria bacterium]|nr:hypothetical protein [Deltaproteobacteria bacterium]